MAPQQDLKVQSKQSEIHFYSHTQYPLTVDHQPATNIIIIQIFLQQKIKPYIEVVQ